MLLLYAIIPIVFLSVYIIYKPPTLLISYFQWRWKDVLWHVPTSKKIIALTIDDAPSRYTEEILSVLKANNATATFFIIGGQVPGHDDTLQSIIRNSSELGNHAMHDSPSRALSPDQLTTEIRAVEAKIDSAYSSLNLEAPARYFRPGSGFFSTQMRETVANLGYRLVLGDIYPHDPQIRSARVNSKHVLSMLKPGGIVICHDRRGWTVPMLKEVLPEVRRRGYQVVGVSGLLKELDD